MSCQNRSQHFQLVADRSAVVIEARSNVGPILFAASGLTGDIEVPVAGDTVDTRRAEARLELRVDQLASGNQFYDSELLRRIDARRYPRSMIELRAAEPLEGMKRVRVSGDIVFHGVTRPLSGDVAVTLHGDGQIVVTGEEEIDIRDFEMSPPSMLMLRIQPNVRVRLHVEAQVVVGS